MEKTERYLLSGRRLAAIEEIRRSARELSPSDSDLNELGGLVTLTGEFGGVKELLRLRDAFLQGVAATSTEKDRIEAAGRAVGVFALVRQRRSAEAIRMSAEVEWSLLRNCPLLGHIRCAPLLDAGTLEAVVSALSEIRYPPGDRAARLQRLTLLAFAGDRAADGQTARDSVDRMGSLEPSSQESLVLRVCRLKALYVRALISSRRGEYECVARDGRVFMSDRLVTHVSSLLELVVNLRCVAEWELGRHRTSRELLDQISERPPAEERFGSGVVARRWSNRAWLYSRLGEVDRATAALRRSQQHSRAAPDESTTADNLRTRGLIDLARGKRGSGGRAIRLFRLAEEKYRHLGGVWRGSLCMTLADRADLHVRRGEIADALECLRETLELVHHLDDLRTKARCVVIKSYLLLEKHYDASKEDLYEEILRELGVVNSPMLLFEILANLYMFSWDLGNRIDLTDNHFSQLERLREVLDADVFQRLYQKYVVHRVARRTMKQLFGCDPESLVEA